MRIQSTHTDSSRIHRDAEHAKKGVIMKLTNEYQVPVIAKDFSHKKIHVKVPGSKSITNRALLLAMLADGESRLTGAQFSDDSRHFLECLRSLSFQVTAKEAEGEVTVKGLSGALPVKNASLYVGSAGTAARFLSAVLGVSEGEFFLDASEQMRNRPMAPLLTALESTGCEITFAEKEGYFPFTLHAHGFSRTDLTIDIDKSSQFLSALLIAAPLAKEDVTIHVVGTHGMAYIEMTKKMMEQFGVFMEQPSPDTFLIRAGQTYQAGTYAIEPDVSAACYFYALAAVSGCSMIVDGVPEDSLQGDTYFLTILQNMGCTVTHTPEGICVTGPKEKLHGISVNMSACSDQAITLAAIAPFADSPVTITGIGHIRNQESDRISAIAENLTAMDIACEERPDSITIFPGEPKPARIKTHDDHRLAMGFAVTGLFAEGIVIENPSCCKKTFAEFFECLEEVITQ